MARRVFFHIGAPKTGTTYLQRIMWHNRVAMRDAGVLFAGEKFLDRVWATQTVRDMRQPHEMAATAWTRTVDQIHRFDGDAIISHEFFSAASAQQARRALQDLAPSEVHLVYTARDLTRLLPALWQERLKYRFTDELSTFDPEPLSSPPDRHWSWRTIDAADVLSRWRGGLPPSHVHVVTVPEGSPARDLLWRRFADACDFDPGIVDPDLPTANESMGLVESELLRRVNPRIDAQIKGQHEVPRWVRNYLALSVLAPRKGQRIGLDQPSHTRVRERSAAVVADLRVNGYDVIGDLDELVAPDTAPPVRAPEDISDGELLDVALDTIGQMLSDYRRVSRRRDELRQELMALRKGSDPSEGADRGPVATRGRARQVAGALRGRLRSLR